jgi:hypothetical protein
MKNRRSRRCSERAQIQNEEASSVVCWLFLADPDRPERQSHLAHLVGGCIGGRLRLYKGFDVWMAQ